MTAALCFGVAYVCMTVLFLLGCAISRRMAKHTFEEQEAIPDYVPARGDMLDRLAALYGVKRKRLWWTLWLVKESDASVRERCLAVVNMYARGFNP